MPNGHDEELQRMREVGRFWYTVFRVGDFLFTVSPLVLLIGPSVGMAVLAGKAGPEGWVGSLQRIGLALAAALAFAVVCGGLGIGLMWLARWRVGL
jgi:hypothetical protein